MSDCVCNLVLSFMSNLTCECACVDAVACRYVCHPCANEGHLAWTSVLPSGTYQPGISVLVTPCQYSDKEYAQFTQAIHNNCVLHNLQLRSTLKFTRVTVAHRPRYTSAFELAL